jgi:hypothetical protein
VRDIKLAKVSLLAKWKWCLLENEPSLRKDSLMINMGQWWVLEVERWGRLGLCMLHVGGKTNGVGGGWWGYVV